MTFLPEKPFKTIEEQILLLQHRGLTINNIEAAKYYLITIGYYPLINGYGKNFLVSGKQNTFKEEVTFEHIIAHYELDRDLKQLLFQRIIDYENKLKTTLGYIVADSFGVYDKTSDDANYIKSEPSYLDKKNYSKKRKLNKLISHLKYTRNTCNDNPTRYYRKEKNHIPPWILFRNISFWDSITLFHVLKFQEKDKVTPLLLQNYENFNTQLRSEIIVSCCTILREFRNNMAHGSRIYAFKSKEDVVFEAVEKTLGPGVLSPKEYSSSIGKNDFFSLLLSLFILSDDLSSLLSLLQDLKSLKNKYSNDTFDTKYDGMSTYENFIAFSNLPDNYIERLEKSLFFKFNRLS